MYLVQADVYITPRPAQPFSSRTWVSRWDYATRLFATVLHTCGSEMKGLIGGRRRRSLTSLASTYHHGILWLLQTHLRSVYFLGHSDTEGKSQLVCIPTFCLVLKLGVVVDSPAHTRLGCHAWAYPSARYFQQQHGRWMDLQRQSSRSSNSSCYLFDADRQW